MGLHGETGYDPSQTETGAVTEWHKKINDRVKTLLTELPKQRGEEVQAQRDAIEKQMETELAPFVEAIKQAEWFDEKQIKEYWQYMREDQLVNQSAGALRRETNDYASSRQGDAAYDVKILFLGGQELDRAKALFALPSNYQAGVGLDDIRKMNAPEDSDEEYHHYAIIPKDQFDKTFGRRY